jgi:hypothetical protein
MSTQIGVNLALNVQVQNNNDLRMFTFNLIRLTTLFLFLWQLQKMIHHWWSEAPILASDIQEAASFACKVFAIGLNSLAYGLGVI